MQQSYIAIKPEYCKTDMRVNLLTSMPQVLRNGLALILIISLSAHGNAQYQPSSCFATHQAVLWGNISSTSILPTTPPSAGYPFSLAWRNVYPNLVSSSYALSGLKIAEPNKPLSFAATLVSTATGATFTYIPDTVSSIVYAAFSIILVSNCNSGTFYMQRFTYITTILHNANRNISQEFFNIASPFAFSNINDYKIGVFLSSLRCNSFLINNQQQFNLQFISLTPYNLYIRLYSSNARENTLTQVTVTYIVAQISTFKNKLIFVAHFINRFSFATNFGIPAIYNSQLTQKFIIGLNYFLFANGDIRPSQIYFADSGTPASPNLYSLICVNMTQINYFVYALMECDIYSIVDVPSNPTRCRPCSEVMQHCLSCSSPTMCTSCTTGRLVTGGCTNVTGCLSTHHVNRIAICVFCDISKQYRINGSICQCVPGFYMDSTSRCLEICGDSRVFQDQCDDGNTDSGDGCSSTCQKQSYFICLNGSHTHKSDCVYNGGQFKLTLKWIDNTNMQNQGIFAFTVNPPFRSLDRLNLTAHLKFNCDGRGQFVNWKYSQGLLLLQVDYQQNLQGYPANITLIFNPTFIIQKNFQTRFDMVSNGDKLIIVNDYGKCEILIIFMKVLCFVLLFLFAVGSFTHKMIGVEILHAFQIIFLLQALSNNITPVFGLLRYFSIVAGNFLFLSNYETNIYRSQSDIHYSSANQEFSEAIIVGLSIFFSLCIMPSLYTRVQSIDDPQSNSSNFSTKVLRVIYDCLLFPFIIGFLMVNLFNAVIDCQQGPMFEDLPIQLSSALSLTFMLISSLIMSFEVKLLFIKKSCWTTLQGLPRCERAYIPIYLIYVLLLSLAILFDYHYNPAYSLELITVIVLAFFVYMVLRRPYKSRLHNAGQIMNVLMIVYFVGWMIAREYFPQITTEQDQVFCMFLLCSLMATCIVLSSVRIVYEWKEKCKAEKVQPKIDNKDTVDERKQEWNKQKESLQQILNSLNPFCGEVARADERLQQIDKINQQRLMEGNECLYSKKNIEGYVMNLPTILYRRRNESKGTSAENQSPKQRLKDHLQYHSAKKQNK